MPRILIDPSLERSDAYLRHYARAAAAICDRTVPPDARDRKDYSRRVIIPGTERLLDASFSDADMRVGHTNFIDYLCQQYATHGIYVITPDIVWQTILCEIAAQVRARPDTFAALFTTTPDQKQEITLAVGSVEDLPLGDLMEALRGRVPTDIEKFIPKFSTSDELALIARYAAFADVCSSYYNYSTMCCGYQAVEVRGEKADWVSVIDKVALLAIDFAGCGDNVLPDYLNLKVMPTLTRLMKAIEAQDGTFFGDILYTERCGSGGEIEVHGWWAEQMYVTDYRGEQPHNLPSHIARVTWKNLDTGRHFSLNVGLFYSTDQDGVDVPCWGWVRNEIVEASKPIPFDEAGRDQYGNLPARMVTKVYVDEHAQSDAPVLVGYKSKVVEDEPRSMTPYIPSGLLILPKGFKG